MVCRNPGLRWLCTAVSIAAPLHFRAHCPLPAATLQQVAPAKEEEGQQTHGTQAMRQAPVAQADAHLPKDGVLAIQTVYVVTSCDVELRRVEVLASRCHADCALPLVLEVWLDLILKEAGLLAVKQTARQGSREQAVGWRKFPRWDRSCGMQL